MLLQLFRPNLVARCAGPRNEHSKARTPGPIEAYTIWYVVPVREPIPGLRTASAMGASNTARRS